mmetsp:Transcript_25636/g.74084  ORF Transcript_25636/g.74084 Transcript_25636/m.74084 type:complete len:227 (+) Transcript_25636:96-776(+)
MPKKPPGPTHSSATRTVQQRNKPYTAIARAPRRRHGGEGAMGRDKEVGSAIEVIVVAVGMLVVECAIAEPSLHLQQKLVHGRTVETPHRQAVPPLAAFCFDDPMRHTLRQEGDQCVRMGRGAYALRPPRRACGGRSTLRVCEEDVHAATVVVLFWVPLHIDVVTQRHSQAIVRNGPAGIGTATMRIVNMDCVLAVARVAREHGIPVVSECDACSPPRLLTQDSAEP